MIQKNTVEILLKEWPRPVYSPRKKSQGINVHNGILNIDEGDANIMLWAYPELINWPNDIVWVLSPVTNGPDLVGLDEHGTLLIVEAKCCDDYRNPFDQIENWPEISRYSNTVLLRKKWEHYWKQEQYAISLGFDVFGTRNLPGVIPYGSKRRACAHWPEVYNTRILPKLQGDYCEKVNAYMHARNASGETAQIWYIIVIVIVCSNWSFIYKAHQHMKDHVIMRTLTFLEHGRRQGVLLQSKPFYY